MGKQMKNYDLAAMAGIQVLCNNAAETGRINNIDNMWSVNYTLKTGEEFFAIFSDQAAAGDFAMMLLDSGETKEIKMREIWA